MSRNKQQKQKIDDVAARHSIVLPCPSSSSNKVNNRYSIPKKTYIVAVLMTLSLLLIISQFNIISIAISTSSARKSTSNIGGGHIISADTDCTIGEYTVWEEWQDCIVSSTAAKEEQTKASLSKEAFFSEYLRKNYVVNEQVGVAAPDMLINKLPWSNPPGAAVLVEFRADKMKLRISIRNALENLPVIWCIHVAGGQEFLDAVHELFPVEMAIGKLVPIPLPHETVTSETVSNILVDLEFYNQLKGENWLFFQRDSVICSKQRHLLKTFIEKDYGFWGAPWRYGWNHQPYFCGNGGFSLRQKRFMMEILTHNKMDNLTNEDGWICNKALEMLGSQTLSRPPAPFYEELQFAVETMMHPKPFAVHASWKHLQPYYQTRALYENCPELLQVIPSFYCEHSSQAICEANIDRSKLVRGENTKCNWAMCEDKATYQTYRWADSMHYLVP